MSRSEGSVKKKWAFATPRFVFGGAICNLEWGKQKYFPSIFSSSSSSLSCKPPAAPSEERGCTPSRGAAPKARGRSAPPSGRGASPRGGVSGVRYRHRFGCGGKKLISLRRCGKKRKNPDLGVHDLNTRQGNCPYSFFLRFAGIEQVI